ncbi:uncharacterized protein LOC120651817 [Panicum virgatum]|uniref:uncharacterized protein LOC120651817 n=1 Tax=Panicum virgatum TaxID=38727 RepID=UPI0019D59FD3|nr:uncharacterized protein LOC120651817 [Panicum virgatum]
MDPLSKLTVRFHFLGEFINHGKKLNYVGGREAMRCIDRDLVSLPEIVGHLKDHCKVEEGSMLHWLFPCAKLSKGLRALIDDKACLDMADCITDGGVADIYVEHGVEGSDDAQDDADYNQEKEMEVGSEAGKSDSDDAVQVIGCKKVTSSKSSPKDYGKDIAKLKKFYGSISGEKSTCSKRLDLSAKMNAGEFSSSTMIDKIVAEGGSSSDSDFLPSDDSCSEVDEEAEQIMNRFKEYKRNCKKGQIPTLDDLDFCGKVLVTHGEMGATHDGNETPYADSSDGEEESFDELGSDGEIVSHNNEFPRYKDKGPRFVLCLGMKFAEKKEFKNAVTKYTLDSRKVINFVKDEGYRVRAKCDWPTCPWVCLLSTNIRIEGWQISTFTDEHTCPDRRDNKLVTAKRIADKYDRRIRANPH